MTKYRNNKFSVIKKSVKETLLCSVLGGGGAAGQGVWCSGAARPGVVSTGQISTCECSQDAAGDWREAVHTSSHCHCRKVVIVVRSLQGGGEAGFTAVQLLAAEKLLAWRKHCSPGKSSHPSSAGFGSYPGTGPSPSSPSSSVWSSESSRRCSPRQCTPLP